MVLFCSVLFCFVVFCFCFFFCLFFGEFAIAVGFERIGIPGLLVAAEKGGREEGRKGERE